MMGMKIDIDGLVNEPRFFPPRMRVNSFGELEIYAMSVWVKAPSRIEVLFRARATEQARNRWLGRAQLSK